MHNRFKATVMLFVLMGSANLYGAQPAAQSIDPASLLAKLTKIEAAIPLLQTMIKQVKTENQNALGKHVASSYSPKSNQTLSDVTGDVLTALDNFNFGWTCVLTNYAKEKQLRPSPVAAPSKEPDGKKSHDTKQQGKGSPQVPHKASMPLGMAAIGAKIMQASAVSREQKAKAEVAERQVGTNTLKLHKNHPNYAWAMRISHKTQKLAELSLDKTKLMAFRSSGKEVDEIDASLLRMLCIRSKGNLEGFVEYLKALKTGQKKEGYFDKFKDAVGAITGNAHDAALELGEKEANDLIKFLDVLVSGIQ